MKKIFLFLCFLLLTFQGFAQKDFRPGYILQNGDTIKGLVDYRSNQRNAMICTFKASQESTIQTFKPTNLEGYGFEQGQRYETRLISRDNTKAQPIFLKLIVKGTATLYFYEDSLAADHFYIFKDNELKPLEEKFKVVTKPDGTNHKVSEKLYLRELVSRLNGCPEIMKTIQATTLKSNSLQKLFVQYNQCISAENLTFINKSIKAQVKWGPFIGLNNSELKFKGDMYLEIPESYPSGIKGQAGLFLNVTVPKINEKISIQIEGLFTQNKYQSSFSETLLIQPGNSADIKYDVDFELTYLKVPVLVRYTLPRGKFRPYINAGLVNSYALKHKQEAIKTTTFRGNTYSDTGQPLMHFRKYSQGLMGGIGMMQNNSKFPLIAELRYENSNGFSEASSISTTLTTYSIILGIAL